MHTLELTTCTVQADCNAQAGARWVNSPFNFDHIGNALLALFQIATFEGWIELMEDAVNARGRGLQVSTAYSSCPPC